MIEKEAAKTCAHQNTPRKITSDGWKQSRDVSLVGEVLYWVISERSLHWPFLWPDSLLHVLPILFTQVSSCGSSFRIHSLGSIPGVFQITPGAPEAAQNDVYWEVGEGETTLWLPAEAKTQESESPAEQNKCLSSLLLDTAAAEHRSGVPPSSYQAASLCYTRKQACPADSFPGRRLILLRHILLRMSGVQVYEAQMSPGTGTRVVFPDCQL